MSAASPKSYSLDEIAALLGGEVMGDGATRVSQVATMATAQSGHISFLSNPKYKKLLETTGAGAMILDRDSRDATTLPRIVCDNPYVYFAKLSALLNPLPHVVPGVDVSASIAVSATIAASASIGPFVSVGQNVRIGEGSVIGAGCTIGDNVSIGSGCRFYPGVVIYHDCMLGDRVILHSGVVIGADGFGLARENDHWLKIPQIGRAVIGNDVEIGANTTVDRGALDDTVIEDGVKLDNQIQIAHNVRIGAHTAMAGCVGVAGSAVIGRHCTVGGGAIILGHLEIADHVNISAGTLITKSISEPGTYTSALPFSAHSQWLKNAAHLRHLDAMAVRMRELEQRILELERK